MYYVIVINIKIRKIFSLIHNNGSIRIQCDAKKW